jgi:hypothetical protein
MRQVQFEKKDDKSATLEGKYRCSTSACILFGFGYILFGMTNIRFGFSLIGKDY